MNKNLSLKKPAILLATWFGLGLMPKAPGTWGSLGAIPPALIIVYAFGVLPFIAALIALSPISFWATAQYEKASSSHDAKQIVIDEVIGQWIALLPVFYFKPSSVLLIILAFALFRLFDIIKPWPISYCDKNIKGASGVMLDDMLAGIAAAAILTGAIHAGLG